MSAATVGLGCATAAATLTQTVALPRAEPALPPSPLPQFAGQLPSLPSAASNGMAPETPLDIKMGLTSAEDVSHPLRWGFMTAGRICKDMALAVKIAASRGCGRTLGAVAARKLEDAEAFAKEIGCARFYGGDDACKCRIPSHLVGGKRLTKESAAQTHRSAPTLRSTSAVRLNATISPLVRSLAPLTIRCCWADVGTITSLHAEHALMALRGGKHV